LVYLSSPYDLGRRDEVSCDVEIELCINLAKIQSVRKQLCKQNFKQLYKV